MGTNTKKILKGFLELTSNEDKISGETEYKASVIFKDKITIFLELNMKEP